ncbi:phosphatase PAP2 family protein [Shewanella sediminis]|nr:phosphatase PAP2 family protein [Shewanella sediminis]
MKACSNLNKIQPFIIKMKRPVTLHKAALVIPHYFLVLTLTMFLLWFFVYALGLNQEWFHLVNSNAAHHINDLFSAHVSDLGNGAIIGVFTIALLGRHPNFAKRLLLTILLCFTALYFLKNVFAVPRPAAILAVEEINIVGELLTKNSFPSGHTATAFTLAGFVLLSFPGVILRLLVIIMACGAGWARIAVGAHWPEDVFFGAGIGLVFAWAGAYLSRREFSPAASYACCLFLSLVAFITNLTLYTEFSEFESIVQTHTLFIVLSAMLVIYFFTRLLMLSRVSQMLTRPLVKL